MICSHQMTSEESQPEISSDDILGVPEYAKALKYTPFGIGSDNYILYGSVLTMMAKSKIINDLTTQPDDLASATESNPIRLLPSDESFKDGPNAAFVALWYYLNGLDVTTSLDNMDLKDSIQLVDYMSWFHLVDSDPLWEKILNKLKGEFTTDKQCRDPLHKRYVYVLDKHMSKILNGYLYSSWKKKHVWCLPNYRRATLFTDISPDQIILPLDNGQYDWKGLSIKADLDELECCVLEQHEKNINVRTFKPGKFVVHDNAVYIEMLPDVGKLLVYDISDDRWYYSESLKDPPEIVGVTFYKPQTSQKANIIDETKENKKEVKSEVLNSWLYDDLALTIGGTPMVFGKDKLPVYGSWVALMEKSKFFKDLSQDFNGNVLTITSENPLHIDPEAKTDGKLPQSFKDVWDYLNGITYDIESEDFKDIVKYASMFQVSATDPVIDRYITQYWGIFDIYSDSKEKPKLDSEEFYVFRDYIYNMLGGLKILIDLAIAKQGQTKRNIVFGRLPPDFKEVSFEDIKPGDELVAQIIYEFSKDYTWIGEELGSFNVIKYMTLRGESDKKILNDKKYNISKVLRDRLRKDDVLKILVVDYYGTEAVIIKQYYSIEDSNNWLFPINMAPKDAGYPTKYIVRILKRIKAPTSRVLPQRQK